jgi:hypothetical protein
MLKLTKILLEDESVSSDVYTANYRQTFKYEIRVVLNTRIYDEEQVNQFIDEVGTAFHDIEIGENPKTVAFLAFLRFGPFGSKEAAMPTMYGIKEIAKRYGIERGLKLGLMPEPDTDDTASNFSKGNMNANFIDDYIKDPPVNEDEQISPDEYGSDYSVSWKIVAKYSPKSLEKIQPWVAKVHERFGGFITADKDRNGSHYLVLSGFKDLKQVRQAFFDLRMSAVKYNDFDTHIKVYLINSAIQPNSISVDPAVDGPKADFNLNESQKKTIVLLSCVLTKLSHPAPAKELYDSPLFHKSLAYAMSLHPDAIYILSAKHYLLPLNKVISPYNKTLLDMPVDQVREWAAHTLSMLAKVSDFDNDNFIILAGDKYRKFIEPELAHSTAPLEGLRIGEQLQWYTKHLQKKGGEVEKI